MAFLRYDEDNLIGAGARVLFAPFAATLPTTLKDVFGQVDPYDPAGTGANAWVDIGATADAPQLSENLTTAGFTIEQDTTVLLEEPTDLTRTLTIPIAEFRPELIALWEESASSTVAAGVKLGSAKKIPFGNIFSLSEFRVAFAVRKSKKQGLVTEGSGGSPVKRGAFLGWVSYRASRSGDNLQAAFKRGQLANVNLQFKVYPDPTQTTEGAESGFWLVEDAPQTIALT